MAGYNGYNVLGGRRYRYGKVKVYGYSLFVRFYNQPRPYFELFSSEKAAKAVLARFVRGGNVIFFQIAKVN